VGVGSATPSLSGRGGVGGRRGGGCCLVFCVPAGRGGEGPAKCGSSLFFLVLMLVLVHGGFMFLLFFLLGLRGEVSGSRSVGSWSVWCSMWEFLSGGLLAACSVTPSGPNGCRATLPSASLKLRRRSPAVQLQVVPSPEFGR
jgi:hypothetical protein